MTDAELNAHAEVVSRHTLADARLRSEVVRAARALDGLLQHRALLDADLAEEIARTVTDVQRRLDRQELAVVVVGEKKSGKSTFLNAILGARVLPTEVRECTGTVTFIRSAPRPTYRATLRTGEVVEFDDHDYAEERAKIASALEAARRRLGDGSQRIKTKRTGDANVAFARATAAHQDASRRRQMADVDVRECEARIERATAEAHSARQRCDALLATAAQLEEQLATARRQWNDAQRAFRGPSTLDLAATKAAAVDAESRLATATTAAPFFLRAAPWWAVWVFVLRFALRWFFLAQVHALADARDRQRATSAALIACEAAHAFEQAKAAEADAATRLAAARQALADAHESARLPDIDRRSAEQQLPVLTSHAADCRRAEDVAELELQVARTDLLEEQLFDRFRAEVHDLTDVEKRGQAVDELSIGFPARHLPEGITIIDTPAVNSGDAPSRARAWDVIRREADGCLLVSDLQQVVGRATREFLHEIRGIIPHVVLVMTKVDGALANARVVNLEPWQRVEEARKNGVRRFAKEIGRAPEEVFSIAVAAEPALRRNFDGELLARRFPQEVAKLFDLLQSERDLVLGARAANALRLCVQRIGEAEARAEEKYRSRIAELEEQRLPDPREFQAKQLAKVERQIVAHAETIATGAREVLSLSMDELEQKWLSALRACESKEEVKAVVAELTDGEALAAVVHRIEQSVAGWSHAAIGQLEGPLLEELRERYRIVQRMAESGMSMRQLAFGSDAATLRVTDLKANVASAVSSFENEKIAFGAGGAIAGAAIGTIFLPGIGTAIGAAIGALATYFKTVDSLRNHCVNEVTKGLAGARQHLTTQLAGTGPEVQRAMHEVLERGLEGAVARFDSWITRVMTDEDQHIAGEREKLSHLIATRDNRIAHDRALAAVQRSTASLSRGMCA